MPPVLAGQHFRKLCGIREIAVVRKANAVRRIDVKRLCLSGSAVATRCWIARVANADVTFQLQHVVLLEDVPDQATALAHVELAFAGRGDARRVLPAVLQYRQSVVEPLIDRPGSDDANNSTHSRAA